MDVTGTRRSVEDEVIEFTPGSIGNELFQCVRCHSTTPERRSIWIDEEADRKQLDTISLNGVDELTSIFLNGIRTFVLHMKHLRHRGTEDIRIQQSNFISQTGQCNGEVRRNGRLAYTTFTGTDSNDVLDLRQHLADFRTGL